MRELSLPASGMRPEWRCWAELLGWGRGLVAGGCRGGLTGGHAVMLGLGEVHSSEVRGMEGEGGGRSRGSHPWHLQVQCLWSPPRVASPTHVPCAILDGGCFSLPPVFSARLWRVPHPWGQGQARDHTLGAAHRGLGLREASLYVVRRVTGGSDVRG